MTTLAQTQGWEELAAEGRTKAAATSGLIEESHPGLTERTDRALDRLLIVAASPDPLVPTSLISETNTAAGSVLEALLRTESDEEVDATLISRVELLVELLTRWPEPHSDRESVLEAASTFRRSAAQQLNTLNQLMTTTRRRAGAVEQSLGANEQTIVEFDGKIVSFESKIQAQEARVDAAITSDTDKFTAEVKARSDAFETELSGWREGMEEAATSAATDATRLVGRIQAQLDAAQDLLGQIGLTGTAGAFGTEAKEQKKVANRWRLTAVVAGASAVAISVLWLLLAAPDDSPSRIASRIAVTVLLGGVAAYAGAQSARHRHREEVARRIELNLTALPTLMAEHDQDQRRAIRENVIAYLLASTPTADATSTSLSPASQLIDAAMSPKP